MGGHPNRRKPRSVSTSTQCRGSHQRQLEVIRQLADSNQVAVVLLQETHRTTDDNLKLSGFVLAGSIPSKHHGMATFVITGITWSAVKRSPPHSNVEWLVTEVQETTIVNVYKPPPSELYPTSLPSVPAPAIYAGDFNCQHTDWGYKHTTKDGETLSDWASSAEAVLLYDPKEPPSFFSARWNTYTNPDLAFAVGRSCDPKPERRIIDRFPRSHHQPSIIKVPSLVQLIAGKPVKRWNFRKANLELFTAETERRTPGLPNPQAEDADATYTAYCNMLIIMRCEEEHPTRLQQRLHPRLGLQLQASPARAPAGHHQGRHQHNGNSTTP